MGSAKAWRIVGLGFRVRGPRMLKASKVRDSLYPKSFRVRDVGFRLRVSI